MITSILGALLVSATTVSVSQAQPQIVRSAPPNTSQLLRLPDTPVFRVDGSERGHDPFHRIPTNAGIVAFPGGFAVASSSTQQLRFYDIQGRPDTVAGRTGEGPGEFRVLSWVRLQSRDSIAVYDSRRRVISLWSTSGTLAREQILILPADPPSNRIFGYVPPVAQGIASDGSVVFLGGVNLMRGTGLLRARAGVMRWNPETRRADTVTAAWIVDYHEIVPPVSPMIAFPRHVSVAVADDRVFMTEGDNYRIETFGLDGRHLRTMTVDRPLRAVTDEHKQAYQSTRPESKAPFRETLPAYEALWHDLAGRLWAAHFVAPTDTTVRWDIFAAGGELIGTLEVASTLTLQASDGTRVYGIRTDEDGVQHVEGYQLPAAMQDRAAPARR